MGKLNGLVKCLEEKDLHTIKLEQKICDMENINDLQNERINKLDKENNENSQNIKMLIEKLSIFENSIPNKSLERYKCKLCDFVGQSAQGLKTHSTRKHTVISKGGYPKPCDLCGCEVSNAENMKKHLKTHSFKKAQYKCEDCDFVGQSVETMEVHNGKAHTKDFECGICEVSFGNNDDLDTHLTTCEVYKCNFQSCSCKETKLSDIKVHMEKEHGGGQYLKIQHLKISRTNQDEVTSTSYYYEDL